MKVTEFNLHCKTVENEKDKGWCGPEDYTNARVGNTFYWTTKHKTN